MNIFGFLLISVIFLSGCLERNKSVTVKSKVPDGYRLIWSDEFNKDGIPNEAFWSYEMGFVRNKELQWYQPQNAFIKDGLLVIEGRRELIPNPNFVADSHDWRKNREFAEYSSASIKTQNKFAFQYGILEVKARIDTSCGSWPAIWTLGVERHWPSNGEIDIMEFYLKDNKQCILANAAWGREPHTWDAIWDSSVLPFTYFLEKDPHWPEKFHIWKMEWTHNFIKIYLDDELLNEIDINSATYPSGFNPFRQPHYILLNLAIGSNGGDPSESVFPLRYEIDYVRVFQRE